MDMRNNCLEHVNVSTDLTLGLVVRKFNFFFDLLQLRKLGDN